MSWDTLDEPPEIFALHDDVIKWKHFHRSPVNSPHKGQWREASIYLFYLFIYLFFFFLRVPEQTAEQITETLVIWDCIALITTSL